MPSLSPAERNRWRGVVVGEREFSVAGTERKAKNSLDWSQAMVSGGSVVNTTMSSLEQQGISQLLDFNILF